MRSTEVSTTEYARSAHAPTTEPSSMEPQAIPTTPYRHNPATISIDDVRPVSDWAGLPMFLTFVLTFGPDAGAVLFWCVLLLLAVIPRLYTTSLRRGWAHTTTATLLIVSGICLWASLPWLIERIATWWALVRGYLT